MKTRKYAIVAAALTLGIAMLVSPGAQSQPLEDRVIVNMPYTTTIGDKVLPPGEYVIQRMRSASGSRVLLIYSDNGMKFETSAMTIPCLDPNVARDTKVVLARLGDDYYYDKVWVQGKSYGYEFILPKAARLRIREMARVTVPAGTSTITTTTTTTEAERAVEEPVEIAQAETYVQAETKAETETEKVETEIAQVETPVETPVAEPEPLESADREMDQNPPPARTEMPKTSTGWMAMLFGGGALLGTGLWLRKQQ